MQVSFEGIWCCVMPDMTCIHSYQTLLSVSTLKLGSFKRIYTQIGLFEVYLHTYWAILSVLRALLRMFDVVWYPMWHVYTLIGLFWGCLHSKWALLSVGRSLLRAFDVVWCLMWHVYTLIRLFWAYLHSNWALLSVFTLKLGSFERIEGPFEDVWCYMMANVTYIHS